MKVFTRAVMDTVDIAVETVKTRDMKVAMTIEPHEEVIDKISYRMKERRIMYLANGECTPVIGFVLSDLNVDLERIGDHCSNIGVTIIEIGKNNYDMHEYKDFEVKDKNNVEFKKQVAEVEEIYRLPEPVVKKRVLSSQPETRPEEMD